MQFLGFLIMQNKLKPVTVSVIETLNEANIRTIMATGDNVLTAISVGRECNIIEADSEVFLGDIRKEGDKEVVFWKSTKSDGHKINVGTLLPEPDFYKDEAFRPHGGIHHHHHAHSNNHMMRSSSERSFREEDE